MKKGDWFILVVCVVLVGAFALQYVSPRECDGGKIMMSPSVQVAKEEIKENFPEALIGEDAKNYLANSVARKSPRNNLAEIDRLMEENPKAFEEYVILPDDSGVPSYIYPLSAGIVYEDTTKCQVVVEVDYTGLRLGDHDLEFIPYLRTSCVDSGSCDTHWGKIASCYQWGTRDGSIPRSKVEWVQRYLGCVCTLKIFQ